MRLFSGRGLNQKLPAIIVMIMLIVSVLDKLDVLVGQ